MPAPIFNNPEIRKKCFEVLLQKKFGKQPGEVTKEELLSLTISDFKSIKLDTAEFGNPLSFYNWFYHSLHGSRKSVIFAILKDTGYDNGIREEDCTNASRAKMGPQDRFSNPKNRKVCFEEFLQNKFGKPATEVKREELLSLVYTDFQNKTINQTSVGSAVSLTHWFSKYLHESRKNVLFAILDDTGYANGIAENDCKNAARAKITAANAIFSKKQNRMDCFKEFLQNKFGKPASDITRDELLSLGIKDFKEKRINRTSIGSALSLYGWFINSDSRKGANTIFSILKDTGYAKDISEGDCINSARAKFNTSKKIFSYSENRKACFDAFLQKIFGKQPSKVTKEELLSLTQVDFNNIKLNTNESGQPASLHAWFSTSLRGSGKNVLFSILEDTGYSMGMKVEEYVELKNKLHAQHIAESKQPHSQIRLTLDKPVNQDEPYSYTFIEPLHASNGSKAVEVVFSTVNQNGNNSPKAGISKVGSALMHYFPDTAATSDSKAPEFLAVAKTGSEFVIHSNYPLDQTYQNGLSLMGYEISALNLTNSELRGAYFTKVTRIEDKNDSVPLMFKNDLSPYKNALHIIGQYSRKANDSKTPAELYYSINLAVDWIIQMKQENILPPDQMRYIETQGVQKLISVENRAMRRLGIDNQYDSKQLAAGHSDALKALAKTCASVLQRQETAKKRAAL